MKIRLQLTLCIIAIGFIAVTCKTTRNKPTSPGDSGLVNTSHLDYLYTPVTFLTGMNAAGIYIYAEAPDYHLTGDTDEGFTCVDDVARAAQVYLRSNKFSSDTSVQAKAFSLIEFIPICIFLPTYSFNPEAATELREILQSSVSCMKK